MVVNADVIVDYIRLFIINMCVFYCFEKISNYKDNHIRNNVVLIVVNFALVFIFLPIKSFNSVLLFAVFGLIYAVVLSKLTKKKLGYTVIITVISYAITFVAQTVGIVIQFLPYKLLYRLFHKENIYISLIIITIIQVLFLYGFFKIRKFRNGFTFISNKLNSEIIDIIMLNISIVVTMIYCLTGSYHDEITRNLLMTFFILGIIMLFTIQKMLTMYYKQKLLTDTMEEYKKELVEKQNEIDKLKADKKNVSKITHEFYNRQKALELLVGSNMEVGVINKEGVSLNILKMIESLTNEYSQRFENMKDLPKLETTDIPELDNMFKYMQSECNKNNIEFKLKIVGNIHTLVNNVIAKNKLETLIGDHLRDAINAVNLSHGNNKEILAVLGIKDKKYEFSVFDTGVDFEIDTLLKLGLEPVTTNKDNGGTGTGFITTFETINETKASLVITEYPISQERHYTKCVSIRFDGKNQYKICSYRANEIEKADINSRIKAKMLT